MEDDLMRIFGTDRVKGLMQRLGVPEDTPIENKMISNSIEKAQTRVEGHHFDVRKHLVEYDDVINKQRTVIYEKRLHILDSAKEEPKELRKLVLDMVTEELEQVISFHTAETDQSKWNLKEIAEVAGTIFPVSQEVRSALAGIGKISGADGSKRSGDKAMDTVARTNLIEYLVKEAKKQYEVLEAQIIEQSGVEDTMRQVEKEIMIRSIDNLWVDHLDAVSAVRTGIGLRGYGQRDPLIEFKKETYRMFMELQNLIQRQVVYSIYKVGITSKMTNSIMDTDQQQTSNIKSSGQFKNADPYANVKKGDAPVVESKVKNEEGDKVGRNDPCPCGSGKKYKKCCG